MFQFETIQFNATKKMNHLQSTLLLPSNVNQGTSPFGHAGGSTVDYANVQYSHQSSPPSNSSPQSNTSITTYEPPVDDSHVHSDNSNHSNSHTNHQESNLSPSNNNNNSQRNPFIGRSLCVVCKDKARGCNFGSITCASCKEFFRRNAFKFKKLKCYFQSKCEINVYSRRFCAACRLLKCYQMGMKSEYIMSDAEKYERQLKIIERKLVTKNGTRVPNGNKITTGHNSSCLLSPNSMTDEATKEFFDFSELNHANNNHNNPICKEEDFENDKSQNNHNNNLLKFDSNSPNNNDTSSLDRNCLVSNIKKESEDSFVINKIPMWPDPQANRQNLDNPTQSTIFLTNHNRYSLFNSNSSNPLNPNSASFNQNSAVLFGPNVDSSAVPSNDHNNNLLKSDTIFFNLSEFDFDDNLFGEATATQIEPMGSSSLPSYPESGTTPINSSSSHNSDQYYYYDFKQQPLVPQNPQDFDHQQQQYSQILRTNSFGSWANQDLIDESETVRKLLRKVKIIRESSFYPTKFRLLLQTRGMAKTLPHHDSCKLKYLTSIVLILQAEAIHEFPTNQKFIDLIRIAEIVTFNFIKMCKKMAAFQALSQEDQVALVKGSVMETLIVWSVMTINLEKECWEALDLERNIKFSLKLELLKEANYKLYEKHQKYALSFEPEWRFNDNLMSLLIAIVLFNPNRPEISNVEAVRNAQIGYCNLLRSYLGTLYVATKVDEVYNRLLNQLKLTETISEYHVKAYFDVNANDISKNGIGGLIMEILDLNE